jgi:TonB-linked SusC/RagA family outer membrane protein
MKSLILFFSCLLAGMSLTVAQTKQVIAGTVIDENGEAVIGASVALKTNVAIGTVTDIDGRFQLEVPGLTEILVVKYLGKETREVVASMNMTVTLRPSTTDLDEVLVVAYGTAKRSSFTGSASVVGGDNLQKMQASNLGKVLEGKVAGLEATSGSGQPGASASLIIRGLGSISAGRSPLIVMDGVPYEGSLNTISSFDIESLTVLKDATANSMYGARGSNGVIILTTKKGREGKASIHFDARAGINSRGIPAYDVMDNPGEYYEMYWEALRNYYLQSMPLAQANAAASAGLIDKSLIYNVYKGVPNDRLVEPETGKLNPAAKEKKWNDNWLTDPFRKGWRQEYNLNVSSGNDLTNLYASLSYLDDRGYVVNSDFMRTSVRLKADQKIGEHVKTGISVSYVRTNQNNVASANSNYSNIFMFGQEIAPIYPVYLYDLDTGAVIPDKNGNKQYDFGSLYARPYASEQNPLATIGAGENTTGGDATGSRGFFEVTFLKDFKFTVNLAYDVFNTAVSEYMTPIGGDAKKAGGRGIKQSSRYEALNVNQLLNYARKTGLHSFDVLLGHETKQDNRKLLYGQMTNYVDPANSEFSNAAKYRYLTSSYMEYALEGYFGRIEYNYADKYYLTGSLRADASSRFHPDVRWGNFWALGASWRVSQETFLDNAAFINDLKLKAAYGTQGNDNLLNPDGTTLWYGYNDLYSIGRVDGEPARTLILRGNPRLTWEKSNNFNTGIELLACDSRLSLIVEYFIKETKDLLYQRPLPLSEGTPNFQWVNDIDMKNKGVEIEIGWKVMKTNSFKWNVNLNATHYRNRLTRLPSGKPRTGYQAGIYWRETGGSIFDFYTYEYAGVDRETGLAQYKKYVRDEKGNEKVEPVNKTSEATLRKTGKTPLPDWYGGLTSSIDCLGFDFSIHTAFRLGGYVMDEAYRSFMNPGRPGTNFHRDILKRWTPENNRTDVPKLFYENQDQADTSDRWLTGASSFSISNITLGYTFPKKWIRELRLERVRLYAVADNVWYISKRKGLDVRQSFSGETGYVYSPLRTVSLGVSADF